MYLCCTLRGFRPRETIILDFGIRKWRQASLHRPTKTWTPMFVQWISEKDEVAPLATGGIRNLELGRKCLSIHDDDGISQFQVSKLPSSMFVHPNSRGLLITCHLVHRYWQQVQLISSSKFLNSEYYLTKFNLSQFSLQKYQLRSWKSREGSLQSQRWLWRKNRGIGAEGCSKSEDCNKIAILPYLPRSNYSERSSRILKPSQPARETDRDTDKGREKRKREKESSESHGFGELLTFSDT